MSMDDLLKGLALFKQGVQDLAVGSATRDANEQLATLNQQVQQQLIDQEAAQQAAAQIQQSFAARLGASGADAAQIQAMTQNIAPSIGARFAAEQNMQLQQSSQAFSREQAALDRSLQRELKGMDLAKTQSELSKKDKKELGSILTTYQKEFNDMDVKKDLESFSNAKMAVELAKDNKPIANKFLQMLLAKTQTGAQMTDAEREAFGGSPAVLTRVRQAVSEYSSGKNVKENQAFLVNVANKLYSKTQNALSSKFDLVSGQAYERVKAQGYETTLEDVKRQISPDLLKMFGSAPAAQGSASSGGEETFKVQAPNGQIKIVPKSQVKDAIKAGGRLITR